MEATTEQVIDTGKYTWEIETIWNPVYRRHEKGKRLECTNPDYIEVINSNDCFYGAYYAYHNDYGWIFDSKMKFKDSGSVLDPKVKIPVKDKGRRLITKLYQLIETITFDCEDWADWHRENKGSLTLQEVNSIIAKCIELRKAYYKNKSHTEPSTTPVKTGAATDEKQQGSAADDNEIVDSEDVIEQIWLPESEFSKLPELSELMAIASDKPFKKAFVHNGKTYAITGSMGDGKLGYKMFWGNRIEFLSVYTGDVTPLRYQAHFDEVNLGNRKQSYTYMKGTFGKTEVVFMEEVEFLKKKPQKPLNTKRKQSKQAMQAEKKHAMSNAVTKIQLERAVVGHLIWLCAQRSRVQFPGKLFISLMAEEELSKLEKSLYAKKEQKKATVNFTYAQLVCVQAVLEGLETTPVVKVVDGLQQIRMFDDTQGKAKRDPDAELYGYKAKDKGDRQRFKRKLTQLCDKLNGLPVIERNALIRGLNAKFTPPPTVDGINY